VFQYRCGSGFVHALADKSPGVAGGPAGVVEVHPARFRDDPRKRRKIRQALVRRQDRKCSGFVFRHRSPLTTHKSRKKY